MESNMSMPVRHGISYWIPWPLATVQAGMVAAIAAFGPMLGSALLGSLILAIVSIASPAGFAVITLAVSHVIEVPGLSDPAVFGLKWVVSGIVLGVVLARFSVERRSMDLSFDTAELLLLFFAIWCGVCSLFAIHQLSSLAESARLAVYPFLVVVVRETLTSRRDIVLAVLAYALAAIVSPLYSASGMDGSFIRFAGFTGNANVFGLIHSFIVPSLVAAWIICRGFILRCVLFGAACASLAALVLSWSRASVLSVIVQGVVLAILFRKFKLLLAGAVLSAVVLTAILLTPGTRDLLFTTLRVQAGTTHRTLIWAAGLESALRSPIVGHGFNLHVGEVVSRVNWGDWGESFVFKSHDAPFYPHNLYVFAMLTAGIPGLVFLLMIVWTLGQRHLHAGRTAPTEGLRIAHFTIVAMVIGAIANGVFEGAALIGKGAINNYFWVSVGIVLAYDRLERKTLMDATNSA